MGPMVAAGRFVEALTIGHSLPAVQRIQVELFGSLGLTGRGHGSDRAVLLGLQGETPEHVDVDAVTEIIHSIRKQKRISLARQHFIPFNESEDLIFHRRKSLKEHPNGIVFKAFDHSGDLILEKTFFSIGGGFVIDPDLDSLDQIFESKLKPQPYPYRTAKELLQHCQNTGYNLSTISLENEKIFASEAKIKQDLLNIWQVMQKCIQRGCQQEGLLPGGLKVRRRAPILYKKLQENKSNFSENLLNEMDWINLWALAVNEENAGGGRVVTAPTNGAAGILPSVLSYALKLLPNDPESTVVRFLLTAGTIAILYKTNASISGAEVGCQGEVGVACSMAAGALTEVLGGTPLQVENAAEIGMEHNLGLTCDPIAGLVQIPCIERNAMGAVKAINASRLALRGDGQHFVSLDKVILTMKATGADMKSHYKETAKGGLAVNITEC
jgi:L-serine dehydratase